VYLNLVLEYIPETIYQTSRAYSKARQTVPLILIKVFLLELLKSSQTTIFFFLFFFSFFFYSLFECSVIYINYYGLWLIVIV